MSADPYRIDAHAAVQRLLGAGAISVGEQTTLRALAGLLSDAAIGVALVRAGDGSVGIVSERDVVKAIADGADPDEIWVADVMTPGLVTAEIDERILEVARRMVGQDVRHVAVVDRGEVVGVVSTRDILPVLVDDLDLAP